MAHIAGLLKFSYAALTPHAAWMMLAPAASADRIAGYRMRQGLQAKFEREVDPEGKLSPQERSKRAEYARKAHMQRMALKSAKARRRRRT